MAHNLTDVDTFTAAVSVPDGGDARTAASVEVGFQSLANRTRNNKNRLDAIAGGTDVVAKAGDVRAFGDFEYCDAAGVAEARTRTIMLPLATVANNSQFTLGNSGSLTCQSAGATAYFPLPVHTGCQITLVRVAFANGGSSATAPTFIVKRRVSDKSGPSSGTSHPEASDLTGTPGVPGSVSGAPQRMSSGPVATSIVDRATEDWRLEVQCPNLSDTIFWIELTIADPGPRNF